MKKRELGNIYRALQKHEQQLQKLLWHKKLRQPSNRPALERHTYYGVHLALTIETRDPLKQGRVQWYSPVVHLPNISLSTLDWAWPISSMGGFDDCGLTWVPPPGSTLCLLFQNGSPDVAFYVGTTWHRNRGPVGNRQWGIPVPEFERIFEGHRGGYMVGANDESQVFQPWNTDQYQGFDLDDQDYDNRVDAQIKVTWPHKYGFKTPEKHMLLMDDGDPKCNRRWKRLEIISSTGQLFLMKDDPYHFCGEWLNPKCTDPNPDDSDPPTICTGTVYCQWEIVGADVIDEGDGIGPITLTLNTSGSNPCGQPTDGMILAVPNIPGVLGAEGIWTITGSGSNVTLDQSTGLVEGDGFEVDPEARIYTIQMNPDGSVLEQTAAVCPQGPDDCPTNTLTTQSGLEENPLMGYISNITDSSPEPCCDPEFDPNNWCDVTNTPCVTTVQITTTEPHNLNSSNPPRVTIAGVQIYDLNFGIPVNINGSYNIAVTGPTTFNLLNATPIEDATYITGSGIWIVTVQDEYAGTEGQCLPGSHLSVMQGVSATLPTDPSLTLKQRYDLLKLGHCHTYIDAMNDCLIGSSAMPGNVVMKNKYHKHRSECAPYLNGKCALDQTGIQIMSRSGATIVFADSVEEPKGYPGWELGLQPYDMDGCTGVFTGRTFWESATHHVIEMNDEESQKGIRGKKNGIHIRDATGNYIWLSAHSKPCCRAGETRGVHIGSTSKHTIDMVDAGNEQCSEFRQGCGKPAARADRAYIRIRSGYGITVTMNDAYSQTKTDQQYFQIMSPQTDNVERGPHILHMQEKPSGPGQVFLRAGGDFIIHTYDNMVEVVGVSHGEESDNHITNKLEFISGKKIVSCGDYFYSTAKNHLFWSDDYIFLLAGEDCRNWDEAGNEVAGPCVYPVVVACQAIPEFVTKMTGIKASERVFASAKPCQEPCLVGGNIGTNTLTTGGQTSTLSTGDQGTFTLTTGGG